MAIVTIRNAIASDSTTFASAPSENHGQSTLLALDNGAFIWMKIDIPAGVVDATRITSANLIMKTGQAGTQNLVMNRANAAWDENTITHANKPATTAIRTLTMGAVAANTVRTFDITTEVKNFVNGTWANNGLNFVGSSGSNRVTFYSGEAPAADQAILEIVYDQPSVAITVTSDPMVGAGRMPEAFAQQAVINLGASQDYNYASSISTDNQFLDLQRVVGAAQTVNFGLQFPNTIGTVNKAVLVLDLFDKLGTGGGATIKVTYPSQTANMIPKPAVVTNTFVSAEANDLGLVRIPLDTTFFNDAIQGVKLFVDITASGSAGAQVNRRFRGVTATSGTKPYTELTIDSTSVNNLADPMNGTARMVMPTVTAAGNASTPAQPMVATGRMVMPTVTGTGNVSVSAAPMVASARMVDSTVSTVANIVVNADSMNVTGSLIEPGVSAEYAPDVTVITDTATGMGYMLMPTVVAEASVDITADPMVGSAAMGEAFVDLRTNVNIIADSMNAKATLPGVDAVNGQDISFLDDPFYSLALSTTDDNDMWYRFTEKDSDTSVKNVRNAGLNGTLVGGPRFVDGYRGHKAIQFDGIDDHIVIAKTGYMRGSTEFYIRTDGKNQVIASGQGFLGADRADGTPGFIGQYETEKGSLIEIANGRMAVRGFYLYNGPQNNFNLVGRKDIADGQWHQVVITDWWYTSISDLGTVEDTVRAADYINQGGGSTSIYIDGVLDARSSNPLAIAMPNTIGRYENRYFKGELSEFIHRSYTSIAKYYIEQLKYAFFQDDPIRAGQMRATASMGDAKGKGNTKRILALHFRSGGTIPGFGLEGYNPNLSYGSDMDITREPTYSVTYGGWGMARYDSNINDATASFVPGAKIFFQSVYYRGGGFTAFRDEITDEPRYIDLQKDIDVEDFDAIVFVDYPGVNYNQGPIPRRIRGRAFDNFIESVKKASFDGQTSLYISQPQLAKDLGIVNNWTKEVPYRDSTLIPEITSGLDYIPGPYNGYGGDYRAAYNNPFVNPHVASGDEKARAEFAASNRIGWDRHWETHIKNNHRVAAQIEGITDVPGYTVAETVVYYIAELDYIYGMRSAVRLDPNEGGLKLGQEFQMDGPVAGYHVGISGYTGIPTIFNFVSYAPEHINAGTAITKQQLYLDDRFERKLNPLRENATAIVVQPGDVVDGRTVNGRIVIDPNDLASFNQTVDIQKAEDFDTDKNAWRLNENAETRKWQISDWRVKQRPQTISVSRTKILQGKDGTAVVQVVNDTYQANELVDAPRYETVKYTSLQERLWKYALNDKPNAGDGSVRVAAQPMTATGTMAEAKVDVVSGITVIADTMVGRAKMVKPREDTNGDVIEYAFPMRGRGKMLNTGETIMAEPMRATGKMVMPFDSLYNPEDVVYLVVTRPGEITLTRNGDNK